MNRNEFKAILNRQDMSDVDRKKLLEGFDEQSNVTDKINIIDVKMLTGFPECVYTYDFSTVNDDNFRNCRIGDLDYYHGPLNIQGLLNALYEEEFKTELYNTIKDLYNIKNDSRITIAYCKNKNDVKSIIRYHGPSNISVYIKGEKYYFYCFVLDNLTGQYSNMYYGNHPNSYFYIGIADKDLSGGPVWFEDLDLSRCYIAYCLDYIPKSTPYKRGHIPILTLDATWKQEYHMFEALLHDNRMSFNLYDTQSAYQPISYYYGKTSSPYILVFYDYTKNKHIKVSISRTQTNTNDYQCTFTVTNIEEL